MRSQSLMKPFHTSDAKKSKRLLLFGFDGSMHGGRSNYHIILQIVIS